MRDLKNDLEQNRKELTEKLSEIDSYLLSAPEGSIHCERRNTDVRYFLCDSAEENEEANLRGTYIRREDEAIAGKLAQKKYYENLRVQVERELRLLSRMIAFCDEQPKENVYASMNIYRKKLVTPMFVPAGDIISKWFTKYQTKSILEGETGYLTVNGKVVRTKSEKAIANALTYHGVPFKYECHLKFKGCGNPVYPDFTVLNMRTGEEFFWEHLSLSEKEEVPKAFGWRLDLYARNRIYLGENLILSYETPHSPLDLSMINHYIERYLV